MLALLSYLHFNIAKFCKNLFLTSTGGMKLAPSKKTNLPTNLCLENINPLLLYINNEFLFHYLKEKIFYNPTVLYKNVVPKWLHIMCSKSIIK